MKKQKTSLVLLISSLAALVTASANGQDNHEIEGSKPPYLAINFTRVLSSKLKSFTSPADVFSTESQLSAGLHRFWIGRIRVDLGVDYQYTRYEYNFVESRNRDLHHLQVPFYFHSRRGHWLYQGYIAPGISTSSNIFKDFLNRGGRDDLHLSGRFEARKLSKDTGLFAGVAYDRTFGRSRLYPVAGVEIFANNRLRLRLSYPDPGVWYTVSDHHSIAARLVPAGHKWHVVADDFSSDFDYRVNALRSQLTWSIMLGRKFTIDFSGGYEFRRRHHLTDDQGVRINVDVEDQWLVAIGLRFGPPCPKVNYNCGTGI